MLKRIVGSTMIAAVVIFLLPSAVQAEVGDPTLQTDHPVYAGEGAFQEIEDCVTFATRGASTPQDKAIAMFQWILQHQYHLHSPQEWGATDHAPDVAQPQNELIPYDANIARFSYGYGLCGTVHAWNEPYWRALGFEPRRRAFPGHTNSEIRYDGGWHAYDTDMAGLVFRKDGVVAGYEDIAKDHSLVRHSHPPTPCYPFAWPSDFKSMQGGWSVIAKQGADKWHRLYSTGYAAQPGVVHLRSGESFTRWFDRDHFGGMEKRRFWHGDPKNAGGPFRDWTFVNTGHASHPATMDRQAYRGDASYCNAEFVFTPDLGADSYREGVVEQTANLAAGGSPKLKSRDGQPASIVFSHCSPYVIAGDPVDDKNPMGGKATDGVVMTGQAIGQLGVEVSTDQGLSWKPAGNLSGEFRLDLTEQLKGRHDWRIRLGMKGDSGLNAVTFATTCQMNQAMYPQLQADGSQVTYRCASRGVVAVRPNFARSEATIAQVEAVALRSKNMVFKGSQVLRDMAYQTTDNKPGVVVFQVDSPGMLRQVTAAANFKVRSPTPSGTDFKLEVSTDGGKSWRPLGKAELPTDNDYSNGWMYGSADVSDADVRSALVKVQVYQGGYSTGLFDVRLYGLYQTNVPQATIVSFGWKEGAQSKTHTEQIPAGAETHTFTVPTGKAIVNDFVRIEAQ
ncbi:hypothetical protein [Lignipirellula cremea]|uniref:Uncharacterized protein n=1 Tax=Lignipirellula cremea TaxID=2528010 RepID=A0A518DVM6_9BACT|nr:hypothetical protein [Lignipirellula cremea]QDU95886.1 hypothetical protein Pla8534_37050 [Lignipirellula cremea]